MPEILQPAPEIRNRRGLFMVAFLFAGQGTRPPVRREEKGRKKVRVWVQVSNQEPCGFEPGIPARGALKSGGGGGGSRAMEGGQVGTPHPRASGVGSAGVAGLGALRGPMVFPTLMLISSSLTMGARAATPCDRSLSGGATPATYEGWVCFSLRGKSPWLECTPAGQSAYCLVTMGMCLVTMGTCLSPFPLNLLRIGLLV